MLGVPPHNCVPVLLVAVLREETGTDLVGRQPLKLHISHCYLPPSASCSFAHKVAQIPQHILVVDEAAEESFLQLIWSHMQHSWIPLCSQNMHHVKMEVVFKAVVLRQIWESFYRDLELYLSAQGWLCGLTRYRSHHITAWCPQNSSFNMLFWCKIFGCCDLREWWRYLSCKSSFWWVRKEGNGSQIGCCQ